MKEVTFTKDHLSWLANTITGQSIHKSNTSNGFYTSQKLSFQDKILLNIEKPQSKRWLE